MGEKRLVRGNEALSEAAIRAGCKFFTSYPITPQNEIYEYMAREMEKAGGVFVASETEVAGINMVYGASSAGFRAMISSSGVGIALMQECLSAMAAAELPCVVVNISRGGPGVLGVGQFAAQSDYFQATRGGGNGDYRLMVLAPSSVQEMAELTYLAFDLADKHRNPAMILADGILGQMAEGLDLESLPHVDPPVKDWALTGARGRKRNTILAVPGYHPIVGTGLDVWFETPPQSTKYAEIKQTEQRWHAIEMDDAEYVLVAYGTTARVCSTVVDYARKQGIKAGMIRPITLWPFPSKPFKKAAERAKAFLTVEMNYGQMVEDVIIAVGGGAPVHHQTVFLSQPLFSPDRIFQQLKSLVEDS